MLCERKFADVAVVHALSLTDHINLPRYRVLAIVSCPTRSSVEGAAIFPLGTALSLVPALPSENFRLRSLLPSTTTTATGSGSFLSAAALVLLVCRNFRSEFTVNRCSFLIPGVVVEAFHAVVTAAWPLKVGGAV
jgi:hypothetical protein